MYRLFSFIRLAVLFIAGFFLTNDRTFGQSAKLSYYDSTKTMPPFSYYMPDGTAFTSDSLKAGNQKVMIYYVKNCRDCDKEAEIISQNFNDLQSTEFIFITKEDTSQIRAFTNAHHLQNNNRIKFLQDKEKTYFKYCIALYGPSIHIYDKNNKLIVFKEAVLNRKKLLKYLSST